MMRRTAARRQTLTALLMLSAALAGGCGLGPWQREVKTKTRVSEQGHHYVTQLEVLTERDLRSVQLRVSEISRCSIQRSTIRRDTVNESRSFTPFFGVEVALLAGAVATPWWYQRDEYDPGGDANELLLTLLLLAPTLTVVMLDATAPRQRRASSAKVIDRSLQPNQLCGSKPLGGASLELRLSDGGTRVIRTDQAGYVRVPVRPDLVLDVMYQGVVVRRVDIYAPEAEPEEPAPPAPPAPPELPAPAGGTPAGLREVP